MEPNRGQITELLVRWSRGDTNALNLLMPLVYEDLRRLANHYLQQEARAQTLQSTALVHEVYLRLCHQHDPQWDGRAHFFAVAAKMMRRILVDHARRRSATKRGGGMQPDELDEALVLPIASTLDLVSLDESLKELAEFDERKCQVVEMRFFAGLCSATNPSNAPKVCGDSTTKAAGRIKITTVTFFLRGQEASPGYNALQRLAAHELRPFYSVV